MNSPKCNTAASYAAAAMSVPSTKSRTNGSSSKGYICTPVEGKTVSRFVSGKYTSPSPGVKETLGDRFIPVRACANLYERFLAEEDPSSIKKSHMLSAFSLQNDSQLSPVQDSTERMQDDASPSEEGKNTKAYSALLKTHVLNANDAPLEEKVLDEDLSADENRPKEAAKHFLAFRTEYKCGAAASMLSQSPITKLGEDIAARAGEDSRKFPKAPYKILDAPGLRDDFYLNVIDWGATDILGVGLQNTLYTLRSHTTQVDAVLQLPAEFDICSLAFSPRGTHMAVGLSSGDTYIMDVEAAKCVRMLTGHSNKVTCVSWCNDHVFSTGARDRRILDRDLRAPENAVCLHEGHRQEVCGLKWSFDQRYLASGGNDNKVLLWTAQHPNPVVNLGGHSAAVKALAWNPNNFGMLATGGGTADRMIKVWDTTEGKCVRGVDTGSQVCSLAFSRNTAELVSTHGYSQNVVHVWKTSSMGRIATLGGHTSRVLYLATSPDGENVVTGAGDETLRFWNLFPPQGQAKGEQMSSLFPSFMDIR